MREPTSALMKKASNLDRTVISNYLDSVRDVELAIERQQNNGPPRPNLDKVGNDVVKLDDFPSKMKTMMDLVALAFWTDATRVASCIMALESSRRIHDFLDLRATFTGHPTSTTTQNWRSSSTPPIPGTSPSLAQPSRR